MDSYTLHIEGKGMNTKIEIKGKEEMKIAMLLLKKVRKKLESETQSQENVLQGEQDGNK